MGCHDRFLADTRCCSSNTAGWPRRCFMPRKTLGPGVLQPSFTAAKRRGCLAQGHWMQIVAHSSATSHSKRCLGCSIPT
jgi:hypothetical protein